MATFRLAVLLDRSASAPLAVLKSPVMLALSARYPLAVLPEPVVLALSACVPNAVLSLPLLMLVGWLEKSASKPTATLLLFHTAVPLSNDWLASAMGPTATFWPAVVL